VEGRCQLLAGAGSVRVVSANCDPPCGQQMIQDHQFAILLPLIVGVATVECTIFVHVLAFATTVNLFRYEKKRGRLGADALNDVATITLVMSVAFVTHLAEIGLWAVLLVLCGEFQELGTAYYHSAVNYTTLGYGDLLLTPAWRMLGPIEATNGALMFGLSAAMVFAVVQRLILARFKDLNN
jgi:hypothetical protein